ncbi:hypothetical protein ACFL27_28375, partial [candidate division CSSED10-310 bacterium]
SVKPGIKSQERGIERPTERKRVKGEKMDKRCYKELHRRAFIKTGLTGMACLAVPSFLPPLSETIYAGDMTNNNKIQSVIREEVLFAGIRKPIKKRKELEPRIETLKKVCGSKISGPLTHIFRFDTPVDGFDSEIGYPVSEAITTDEIQTHTLRKMHFYSLKHQGPLDTLGQSTVKLYGYMKQTGLSPELELVEIYHHYDPQNMTIENMASFLAWPEVYMEQLVRVLGQKTAKNIWQGGQKMSPHTLVDERCQWVADTINRLKQRTTLDQQFDVLSRVALIRPVEDVQKYKKMFDETQDINTIFQAQHKQLENTPTGGFVDPPRYDGKILHVSKVPYNKKAYLAAKTPTELRKAYCFCNLVREAKNPQIDPIFCYRAAGWARQFWEPILGLNFKKCQITHSILKGDRFCAWDYHVG